jgi:CDP-diacylglycerol--glycerol-3-phosphate 3-phosphatidyltransferase
MPDFASARPDATTRTNLWNSLYPPARIAFVLRSANQSFHEPVRSLDNRLSTFYLGRVAHDLFKVPNLITLGRLVFLVPTAYFLARPGHANQIYALVCLSLAAASDYFDGYFARRLNQQTRLGLLLDPLSDKIMATSMVILLIVYRNFPLWLAAIIVGRDILIGAGSLAVKSRIKDIPRSNLTGKYAFASIAVLMVSDVIEFDFGVRLFMFISLPLIALSLVLYAHSLVRALKNLPLPDFQDKAMYRAARSLASLVVAVVYLYKLLEMIGWM